MASVYKWHLSDNIYAYIMSEGTLSGFTYDINKKERYYEADTSITVSGKVDEAAISCFVSSKDKNTYKNSFEYMRQLISMQGYSTIGLGLYDTYFNYNDSACYEEGNVALCPEIEFVETKQLEEGQSAYTEYVNSYVKPDGTKVFQFKIGIPKGEKGDTGKDGIGGQGPQGATGAQGAQGSTGEQGEQGEDGVSPEARYVSTIFKRGNINPAEEQSNLNEEQPSAATSNNPYYNNPMSGKSGEHGIEQLGWSNGIPSESGITGETTLWMTTKLFTTNASWTGYSWDLPVKATDSQYIDYEWNCNTGWTLEKAREYPPLKETPDEEITPEENNGWYDEAVSGAIFMAVRKVENGVYSDTEWTISKIKGEDGDAGEPLHLGEGWEGDEFNEKTGTTNEAHACIKDDTFSSGATYVKGNLYVWDGEKWVDSGKFTGEASYLHIKYANSTTGNTTADTNYIDYLGKWLVWSEESGETPNAEYTGIYSDNNSGDDELVYKKYKWTYAKGQDGFGYEYIYCATKTKMNIWAPSGGTDYMINNVVITGKSWNYNCDDYQNNYDFIPQNVHKKDAGELPQEVDSSVTKNWADNLIAPTKDYKYVYQVYRRRNQDGTWTKFIGDGNDNAILCNTYTESPEFRSTIFKRSNEWYTDSGLVEEEYTVLVDACETDSGGTYFSPVPVYPEGWTDGVPTGNSVLWMSYRTMTNDKVNSHIHIKGSKYSWSKPVIAEDGKDIDYEWCTGYTAYTATQIKNEGKGPLRTSPDDNNPGCSPFNPDANGWYDNPIDNAVWMTECKVIGGEYEKDASGNINWKYSRIKGEKGEQGPQGEKGEKGADGTGSYIMDLAPEGYMIGLGGDNKLDTAVTVSTKAILYFENSKVGIKEENISIIGTLGEYIETSVTITDNIAEIDFSLLPGLTFEEGISKEFTVKITYKEKEYSKIFKLTGYVQGKDGAYYYIKTSHNSIHYNSAGTADIEAVECRAFLGQNSLSAQSEYNVVYSTGSTRYETYISGSMFPCLTGSTTTGEKYWYFTIINYAESTYPEDREAMMYFYLLSGSNNSWSIIVSECVPYIKDGSAGRNASSIVLDLNNEMLGVGGLGNKNILTTSVTFDTTATLMSGSSKATINQWKVTIDSGMSEYSASTKTAGKISWTGEADEGSVKIKILFNGTTDSGITFPSYNGNKIGFLISVTGGTGNDIKLETTATVVGFKDGVDGSVYRLVPNYSMVSYNSGGTAIIDKVECREYLGTKNLSGDSNFGIYYSIGKTSYEEFDPNIMKECLTTSTTSNEKIWFFNEFDYEDEMFFFYLVSGNTDENKKIVDKESIPYVKDGYEGKDGSSVRVDLSNEMDGVSLGTDNYLNSDIYFDTLVTIISGSTTEKITGLTLNISDSMEEYWGDTAVTSAGSISYSVTDSGDSKLVSIRFHGTEEYGILFPENDANKVEFIFNITGKTSGKLSTRSKTILGLKGGKDGSVYRIIPSVDNVRIKDGNCTPTAITYDISMGGQKAKLSENICLYYNTGSTVYESYNVGMTKYANGRNSENKPTLNNVICTGITTLNTDEQLVLYYISGNTIIDRETIPYVKDGVDGEGYTVCDLDNEMESVGVGDNGLLESETPPHYTTMSMYLGTEPIHQINSATITPYGKSASQTATDIKNGWITTSATITAESKVNVVIELKGSDDKPIDFNGDNARRQFNIVIEGEDSESNKYRGNKVFTIVGVESGADGKVYRLHPSTNVIKTEYNGNNLVYTPTAITCTANINSEVQSTDKIYVTINKESVSSYSELQYPYTACTANNVIPISGISSEKAITENITFYYVEGTTIIDKETVPVIGNGKNGINSIIGDLDNQIDSFSVGSNEILEVSYTAKTVLNVYEDEFEFTGCTITPYGNGSAKTESDIAAGLISTGRTIDSNKIEIEIYLKADSGNTIDFRKSENYNNRQFKIYAVGNYDGIAYEMSKVFTLNAIAEGADGASYKIICSDNCIKYNPNESSYTPSQIIVTGECANTTFGKVYYRIDAETEEQGGNNPQEINIDYSVHTSITLYLKDDNNVIYDKETIPVVYDGEKGEPGSEGTRGRSLYPAGEFDIDSSYSTTDTSAPYVHYTNESSTGENGYYYMSCAGVVTIKGKLPTDTTYWSKMQDYNAIFTDILIAKYGHVGGAIFYDDFMFSKYGVLNQSGVEIPSQDSGYTYFGKQYYEILSINPGGSPLISATTSTFEISKEGYQECQENVIKNSFAIGFYSKEAETGGLVSISASFEEFTIVFMFTRNQESQTYTISSNTLSIYLNKTRLYSVSSMTKTWTVTASTVSDGWNRIATGVTDYILGLKYNDSITFKEYFGNYYNTIQLIKYYSYFVPKVLFNFKEGGAILGSSYFYENGNSEFSGKITSTEGSIAGISISETGLSNDTNWAIQNDGKQYFGDNNGKIVISPNPCSIAMYSGSNQTVYIDGKNYDDISDILAEPSTSFTKDSTTKYSKTVTEKITTVEDLKSEYFSDVTSGVNYYQFAINNTIDKEYIIKCTISETLSIKYNVTLSDSSYESFLDGKMYLNLYMSAIDSTSLTKVAEIAEISPIKEASGEKQYNVTYYANIASKTYEFYGPKSKNSYRIFLGFTGEEIEIRYQHLLTLGSSSINSITGFITSPSRTVDIKTLSEINKIFGNGILDSYNSDYYVGFLTKSDSDGGRFPYFEYKNNESYITICGDTVNVYYKNDTNSGSTIVIDKSGITMEQKSNVSSTAINCGIRLGKKGRIDLKLGNTYNSGTTIWQTLCVQNNALVLSGGTVNG